MRRRTRKSAGVSHYLSQDVMGFAALILILLFIGWYTMYREHTTTRDEVRGVVSDALTEIGIKTPAATEYALLQRLRSCTITSDPAMPAERDCNSLCGAKTCVEAGTQSLSVYTPVSCDAKTLDSLVCRCC